MKGSIVPGIVYLLTNEAMPGLVKIGRTNADDPTVRMDQLYNTSVPVPFDCVLAKQVNDPGAVETALHRAFAPDRVNPRREFFKIDPEQAVAVLSIVSGDDVTPSVNEANNAIPENERASSEKLRGRRPNLNFREMGIPEGATLEPTRGDETAIVVDDRRVQFRGEVMLLSRATRLREDLSYDVGPARYWLYEGRNLREIYNETYPQDQGGA